MNFKSDDIVICTGGFYSKNYGDGVVGIVARRTSNYFEFENTSHGCIDSGGTILIWVPKGYGVSLKRFKEGQGPGWWPQEDLIMNLQHNLEWAYKHTLKLYNRENNEL